MFELKHVQSFLTLSSALLEMLFNFRKYTCHQVGKAGGDKWKSLSEEVR